VDWRFDDSTLDRLTAAAVDPMAVIHVLTAGPPRVRRHIGSMLQVAAQVGGRRWLSVSLVEEADDQYVVTGARWLDDVESAAMTKLAERGGRRDDPR
jgi:hypothetical protein